MWTRGKTLEVNFVAFAKQSCGLEDSYSYILTCCDALRRQQSPEQRWVASSALQSINCSFQFVCKLAGSARHPLVQTVDSPSSNHWGTPRVTGYQLYFESVSNPFSLILFLFRHDFHVDVLHSHHWNWVEADNTGRLSCSYEDERNICLFLVMGPLKIILIFEMTQSDDFVQLLAQPWMQLIWFHAWSCMWPAYPSSPYLNPPVLFVCKFSFLHKLCY